MTLLTEQLALSDSVFVAVQNDSASPVNWWMWVAIVELVIIITLLLFSGRRNVNFENKEKLRAESKGAVDFGNILNSGFNSQSLYDELKIKCHPDRFPDNPEKNGIATSIFQEITKNKNNLKRLMELKDEAAEKLGITF